MLGMFVYVVYKIKKEVYLGPKMNNLILLCLILLFTSCLDTGNKSKLQFRDRKQEAITEAIRRQETVERQRNFEIEKKRAMDQIIQEAKTTYTEIEPIISYKCYSCHNAKVGLPAYGRIFPNINPVRRHQVEGLKALDFSEIFPLKALGNPPQAGLLKSVRNEVVERTMPLRIYTRVYPRRKIFDDDEKKIIAWVDPLIQKLEDYQQRYEPQPQGIQAQAKALLEAKCFRCHANGNHRGDFGGMEDTAALLKSKYVDLKEPLQSKIYTLSAEEKMPPKKQNLLTQDELHTLRDWIEFEAKKP